MAPRDMLATASPQGGVAGSWSWYVPGALTALVIAVVLACIYFRKTLLPWAPWLFMVLPVGLLVAAIAGVEGAEEILRSRADRGPKDFGEFIGMCAVGALIMFAANALRRGRVRKGGDRLYEGGACDGEGGDCDDEGGGWWEGEGD